MSNSAYILFDWDGTLAENFDVILGGINNVFAFFDMPLWSEEQAKLNIRLTAKDLFTKTFSSTSDYEKAIELYLQYVEDRHLDTIFSIDGAPEFLATLKSYGYTLGVVSNKTQRFLDKEVQYLGWNDYFDVVIGAGTAAQDKPNPDSILLALERLDHYEGEPVYYVGDTDTDMTAASRANVSSIFVTFGLGTVEDLDNLHEDIAYPEICHNYNDVKKLLQIEKK